MKRKKMMTSWPSLKRFSICSFLAFTCAATTPTFAAPTQKAKRSPIETSLRADLSKHKGTKFDTLLTRWEKLHGTRAVPELTKIAGDRKLPDSSRYAALMAIPRLGGPATAPLLHPYLKDRTWMMRVGALRALTALNAGESGSRVLPLLKDPALVVRLEAVRAVEKLRPFGAEIALVEVLQNRENYPGGKALWVPSQALQALRTVARDRPSTASQLQAIAPRILDPNVRKQALTWVKSIN